MKIFSWITKDTNINFLKPRVYTYTFSIAMVIMSVLLIIFKGFNYGIDFSGGILIEVASENKINLEQVRKDLSNPAIGLDDLSLQTIGENGDELMIRAQTKKADEDSQRQAIVQIKEILGSAYEYRKIESVGPQVGDELKRAGVLASVIAIVAICIYIWVRFEWQFALGGLIGLFHDVLITVGLLSLFDMDISLTTVAAVLTLAGYSINDTVVTYDRIRENLRKFRRMPQIDLLNKSINDIFSRTILTSLTTMLAAGTLFVLGGDALRSFSFTIVWGIIIGTYSSIYISAVFLNNFDLKKIQEEKEKEDMANPFGNV